SNTCGFGCNGVGGDHLGSGCSDAYGAGLNGAQDLIGSRAWVNPFTGFFAQNPNPNDHSGHVHAPADPTAHRILVDVNDLNTSLEQPASMACTGAIVNEGEPDPGNDGIFFVGYKVTGPNAGVYHYEYPIYNHNLHRAIQSFQVVYPLYPPIVLNNVGFHAPPQHPGWANDGTQNN